ncbi:putative periplasmic triheme cytochrome c [Desulfuromonas soudanensis]|uniref:Putative periplasmic triheme cytochrome c n=1 Tax=Desulfuromonas soudanensis TaxID=1603606 RepID=A0A0M5INT7_9BACT|nr:cytochrome c3 family protein [Desulfuromonas soudanensis]ALC17811.1 putative periplasmic triheme cytochrome c [Desulfuromonas soudanensis]
MKKLLVVLMLVAFAATPALAADTVVLKAKNGDVTFNHKVHSESMECKTCHGEGTPGKIELDKDSAHALCKDCHKTKGAGPTKCGDCHKK